MRYTSRRGTRGGKRSAVELKDIHSRVDGLPAGSHAGHSHNLHGTTVTAGWTDHAGIYDDDAEIGERADTHIIPRQSLTRKHLLMLRPQQIETETRKGRQLDKSRYFGTAKTPEQVDAKMVPVTDQRRVWQSDKTLLRRSRNQAEIGTFKREGVIRQGLNSQKYRAVEPEVKAILEDLPVQLDTDDL